jgi:hypothetical protein
MGYFFDEVNVVSDSPNEKFKGEKEKNLDQATISRALAPKPA